jgi:hypothetical protein
MMNMIAYGMATAATAAVGIFFGGNLATPYLLHLLSPRVYATNSTKDILKSKDLSMFFLKDMEYGRIVSRVRDMCIDEREITPGAVNQVLEDLRRSPFYDDARYKPAYKNICIMQTKGVDEMDVADLHQNTKGRWPFTTNIPPCNSETKNGICTKRELLKELYISLANDG